ncbi:MAG: epoxyqueuosine reductase QueH [Planctomycetota bacterium]|nr:epoxyqueuosine reductase QueH [Planctomycetota bacterium]
MTKKTVLHICCAVCLPGPLRALQEEGFEVTGYFFNPNIHPLLEFRKRIKAVKVMNERLHIPIVYDERYGLWEFLDDLDGNFRGGRCELCYAHRLKRTARFAKENGFESFTSTLLVSHEQDYEKVVSAGLEAARGEGVDFLVRDFRRLAVEGKDYAKRNNIYRQQYCGCVFSEYERYHNTGKELYKGGGGGK